MAALGRIMGAVTEKFTAQFFVFVPELPYLMLFVAPLTAIVSSVSDLDHIVCCFKPGLTFFDVTTYLPDAYNG